MIKLYPIILSLTIAIIFLHTVIPHNHYDEYNVEHSIAHSQVTNIVDFLGLGFHHGSEKDLTEFKQVDYRELDLSAVKLTDTLLIITKVVESEPSISSLEYPILFTKHYKYFYSNNSPLRAPPKEII